jgi:hypothetical protein
MDVDSKKLALVKNDGKGNFDIESGAGHIEIRGIDDETWKSLDKIWKDDAKEKKVTKAVNEPDEPSSVGSAASSPPGSPPSGDDEQPDERRGSVRGALPGAPGRPLTKDELIDQLLAANTGAALDRAKLEACSREELAARVAASSPPPFTELGVAPQVYLRETTPGFRRVSAAPGSSSRAAAGSGGPVAGLAPPLQRLSDHDSPFDM